jgi:hypothetical protein
MIGQEFLDQRLQFSEARGDGEHFLLFHQEMGRNLTLEFAA